MKRFRSSAVMVFILLLLIPVLCPAEEPGSKINLDVKSFSLQNGMLFLVVERPSMPQVAARVAIRAGSALEEAGKTGIAHMLEHMMFKGTRNFGTLDLQKDQELQEKIEAAYQVILSEKSKRKPDRVLIKKKQAEMETLRQEVQKIYVPQVFSSQLGKNGAVGVNAFTSPDQTQYFMSIPSDMIEQWYSIVSEQLFEPSWREFYVEKEVVQREWAFRYVNNPEGAAWLDLGSLAYTAHPYRNPTIGWKSDMETYSTRDAIAFHKRYYNPANAVCVLVGDITAEEAERLAGIYFNRYPSGERAPENLAGEPAQQGPRKSVRFLKGARTPVVRIGFHGARMGTRDFYALDAATMVLSHGRSSRMNQKIVNKGLAMEAFAVNPDNRYGGLIVLGGSPNEPDESKREGLSGKERRAIYLNACEELEELLLEEVEDLVTNPVTEAELDRVRKMNQRDFLDRIRTNEALASTLANVEVQVGWEYLENYLDEMEKITARDIADAVKRHIHRDRRNSVYVIPGGEPDVMPETYEESRSVSGKAAFKVQRPEQLMNHSDYPTPPGWKHPLSFERKPHKVNYPQAEAAEVGGTKLFFLPDHELPIIDLTLMVRAGSVDVPDEKIGLAGILDSSLIRGGTLDHPPGDFALALDKNAVRLTVSVGEEQSDINLSVMKEDWERGLELLQELLTRPRFDPEILSIVKAQTITALKRQGGDATAVLAREGNIWHFRGHPYGRDPMEGLETIPAISSEDLKDFLRRYFVPSNMVVSVAGDITKSEVLKGVGGLLAAMPQGRAPERRLDAPDPTPAVLALIHKPGQLQSQVGFRLRGIERTDPDYWKMNLLMSIFGGSDSLLYTRLRDELGLVYAAYAYQGYKWRAGTLAGYMGCRGDRTADAVREAVNLIKGLRKEVPEWELEQKRKDALNSFIFNVDTPAELVDVYARYYMRNEPLDTLERIQDSYIKATKDELLELAVELLDPARMQVFVVGDKTMEYVGENGARITLEADLQSLARELGLPYQEIPLR